MSGYGTEVRLLAYTQLSTGPGAYPDDAEKLIEYASRLCVDKTEGAGERENYIEDRLKQGHESVIEHASATFYIRCSRVVTHELVRHRIASYSQRSQRYVKEGEAEYITPPELLLSPVFKEVMDVCWPAYSKLLSAGVKPEIARYVLPNACETQIVASWNFREIRHIIKLRTSPKALPEMQEVAGKVQDICVENWPQVFRHV